MLRDWSVLQKNVPRGEQLCIGFFPAVYGEHSQMHSHWNQLVKTTWIRVWKAELRSTVTQSVLFFKHKEKKKKQTNKQILKS